MLFTKKETKQQSATEIKVNSMYQKVAEQKTAIKNIEDENTELEEKVHDTSLSVSEVIEMKRKIAENNSVLETLKERLQGSLLTVEEARTLIDEIKRTETPTSDEAYKKAKEAMVNFYNAVIDYENKAEADTKHIRNLAYQVDDVTIRVGDYQKDLNAHDYMPSVSLHGLDHTARELQQEYKF
ncbi:hypothetical protein [Weissella paramesenteroides]|uniref:hypothetical protein n=1 Tax=Weissella paramesenteroides TaxID=1249 RepID=UPI002072D139|nr:hypothetical protein [Weissella paramesenteroides]MCM6765239.1 hypothetical protein [Weissella paramesenteroides]MCM6766610.1 hypothetical protein [Weissella paramesenteroides]MCM6771660.1 hypothetical protein [Weissella paramesenteroides]MCM6779247.1 hypothetical protein [Weissella paramesenteroides]MCM6782178.1 hypothetical protein [Weissella paramesenteroides]